MSTRAELLNHALWYAARGWRVLPLHYPTGDGCSCVVERGGVRERCDYEGKHPAVKGGCSAATLDPERIARWWASKPYNVGIATGAGTRGGLLVVDIDPRHAGDIGFELLEAAHERLPFTVEGCTGGGGRHLLFTYDPAGGRVPCSVAKLGAGVDVRADGGLIVAPPSVHASGRAYGWELSSDPLDVDLAEAPAWLLGLCRGAARVGVREGASRARGQVEGEAIPDGQRGDVLYRLACGYRARGLDDGELLGAMLDVNASRCVPPCDEARVAAIVASACRHAPGLSPSYAAQRDAGEHSAALAERKGLRVVGLDEGRVELPVDPDAAAPLAGGGAGEGRASGELAAQVASQVAAAAMPPARHGAALVGEPGMEREGDARRFLRELLGDLVDIEGGDDWQSHLSRGRKGSLENSLGNMFLILRHDRRVTASTPRFNELSLYAEIGARQVTDEALTALRAKVERHWAITPGKDTTEDALRLAAKLEGYNPVKEYLEGLVWDGVPRLDSLAYDWLGVDRKESLYGRYIACFFLGAVRRIYFPGYAHQSVLVLVGPQGYGKSYFFKGLAGPFFNESKIEVGEKDGALKTHCAWIHEFPEVEQVTLFREASAVKSFITLSCDTFRPPYGRATVTVPRTSLFGATTNQRDFLRDESGTGSRRWHPIFIKKPIDRELVDAMRDQLWAEAVARSRTAERSYLDRDEEKRREVLAQEFYQLDPWENAILRWLPQAAEVQELKGVGRYGVSATDLFTGAIGLRRSDPGVGEARRLGGLMKRLGWEHSKQRFHIGSGAARRKGVPEWGYLAPQGWKPADGTSAPDDNDDEPPLEDFGTRDAAE